MKNLLDTKAVTTGVVVVLAAGAIVWIVKRYGAQVAEKLNPVSDKNAAYTGVNAVGAALTGQKEFSLGSWLYDKFNPEYDPNAPYKPSTGLQHSADVLQQGAAATDTLWGKINKIIIKKK